MKFQIDYLQSPNGLIKLYNLTDWWNSTFSNEEKNHIIDAYRPIGMSGKSLIKGDFPESNNSVVNFLCNLSGWFDNKEDRNIAIEILKKAESLVNDKTPPLDYHFLLQHIIRVHYSNRYEDLKSLNKAIFACAQQIEFAPNAAIALKRKYNDENLPIHVGYEQMAIVKEKEKKYHEVVYYCTKAMEEGWRGNWKERIERCQNKSMKGKLKD